VIVEGNSAAIGDERQERAKRRAENPWDYFWHLIEQGPVSYLDSNPELLRREDVEFALRDPSLFSSSLDTMGSVEPTIPLNVDPPEHVRYRRLLDPFFAPRRMAALEPAVAAHANDVIDTFIDRGECDFSTDLAVPLPCSTFLRLLGLPLDELPDLIRWKDVMVRAETLTKDVDAARDLRAKTAIEVYTRLNSAMKEHREEPRDDLVSFLLNAQVDGQGLTDGEIVRICFLLLAAGLDTVTISLECIFSYLLGHPNARNLIVAEPEVLPRMIEELMRWETPVQSVARRVTREVTVAGTTLGKDDIVTVSLASANIDPAVPGATMIDFGRAGGRHLAFGLGIHRCLGSHLARMELQTVVREWHRRIPEYSLAPGSALEWNGSILRGIDHMPVVWPIR
jgi:cytochrome P450